MKIGEINKFKVLRETNLGYMLLGGDEEFFLHHNECNGKTLFPDDEVEAFLYADKKGRVAATLHTPKATLTKCGFCEVVGKTENGVFVNIGISKDILLSRDVLPEEQNAWPNEGDVIFCKLRIRSERLLISPCNKEEILSQKEEDLEIGSTYDGYVYRLTKNGINVVTLNKNVIFIYFANIRKKYRLGEKVSVKILHKNEDDFSGTVNEQKEHLMVDDAKKILEYLASHGGTMMVTEDSDADVIYHLFKMSKSAFKRAIGKLYKERKILILEDKIILE